VTAEELGGADVHTRISGVADHLALDDEHALEIVRGIVATLNTRKQVEQDIPIWNAKKCETRPLLVKGDGPILAYRKQYEPHV
jgi:acetyl-CoA carboxylase carboxyltransferase component